MYLVRMTLRRKLNLQKGSLLIVAMILSAVIGVSLASYLQLSKTTLTLSNRAFYNHAAMNLAENGLEEAMYALHQYNQDSSWPWAGWAKDGNNAWRLFPEAGTSPALDKNASGIIRVCILDYLTDNPTVVARSTITLNGAASRPIEKWVKIDLKRTSPYTNGLVASQQIVFNGSGTTVDSWNSDPDDNRETPAIPYHSSRRNPLATVGGTTVFVSNTKIYGYVKTTKAPVMAADGLIGDFATRPGSIKPTHLSTDFAADFPSVTNLPPRGKQILVLPPRLPAASDTPITIDGKPTYCYYIERISLAGSAKLQIEAPNVVVTVIDPIQSVTLEGNAQIAIDPGASLKLYAFGNISIAGNGAVNGGATEATANPAENFQIWGTRTQQYFERPDSGSAPQPQQISVRGNPALSVLVYAPYGNVTLRGTVMGSVLAHTITVEGNTVFHYDESLDNLRTNEPFRVSQWHELSTAVDRSTYTAVLDF